jgi:ATP-dependent Clp protease ATP-binding subunit ClpB
LEAASKLGMEIDSMPSELDEIERRIMQLEIERQALSKETDAASKERLEAELADLREQSTSLKSHWQMEKEAIAAIRATKERLEQTRGEIEQAERVYDLNPAAELRYGVLPGLERTLAEAEHKLAEHHHGRAEAAVAATRDARDHVGLMFNPEVIPAPGAQPQTTSYGVSLA